MFVVHTTDCHGVTQAFAIKSLKGTTCTADGVDPYLDGLTDCVWIVPGTLDLDA